tara:strand:+ start:84 stop:1196 length:1113 start_codon:yes stop_codon:yes gene_type:complete
MSKGAPVVTVIGGGIFGCTTAIALATQGMIVNLFELNDDILKGASKNNFNRVHLGYHYPRDLETALQSKKGFENFISTFSDCIVKGFPNYYFIADQGSKTSPNQYLDFCSKAGLNFESVKSNEAEIEIHNCSIGIRAHEVAYDHSLLRNSLWQSIFASPNIRIHCNARIEKVNRQALKFHTVLSSGENFESDAVVNSSYANINAFDEMIGKTPVERQFEYTVVPIIETDFQHIGIAVMDGPFPSMMPFGKSGLSILYHVEHSVIDSEVTNQLNPNWLMPETSPFTIIDKTAYFEKFKEACVSFIPAIEKTRLKGFLQGPRMVLANRDKDDARPSLVNSDCDGFYITIFSGKVDHSLNVAQEVVNKLRKLF